MQITVEIEDQKIQDVLERTLDSLVVQELRYNMPGIKKQLEAKAMEFLNTVDITALRATIDEAVKKEVTARANKLMKAI